MKICEIFHSIQGEGMNAGKPATFVRFFGCNLACSWCDTKYSWHPKYAEWEEQSLEQVIQNIRDYDCSHVIFTGGEPALFQQHIRDIVAALPDDFTYEIESNGTLSLCEIEDIFEVVTISPKLKNSGNVSELKALSDEYCYKFVIVTPDDISEVLDLQQKHNLKNIVLMAEGKTRKEQEANTPFVQELCQQYGFHYSPRLHSLKWDGAKGK